jgi:hypothetical protein
MKTNAFGELAALYVSMWSVLPKLQSQYLNNGSEICNYECMDKKQLTT